MLEAARNTQAAHALGGLGGRSREELRKLAVDALVDVVEGNGGRGAMAIVSAAAKLIDLTAEGMPGDLKSVSLEDLTAMVQRLRELKAKQEGRRLDG